MGREGWLHLEDCRKVLRWDWDEEGAGEELESHRPGAYLQALNK